MGSDMKDVAETHHSLKLAQIAVRMNSMGLDAAVQMLKDVKAETQKALEDAVGKQERCKKDKAEAETAVDAAEKTESDAEAKSSSADAALTKSENALTDSKESLE